MRSRSCILCFQPLVLDVNWREYRRANCNYLCDPCYNRSHARYTEAYRIKHREEAREATRLWRLNNPAKYQAQLERAKKKRTT
jgi:5-methylcytosine-specific restriction endonuclease McrA